MTDRKQDVMHGVLLVLYGLLVGLNLALGASNPIHFLVAAIWLLAATIRIFGRYE
jgi:hypothetical protein